MQQTDKILQPFERISLKEMNEVKLLNRQDTKFIFSVDVLPSLFSYLQSYYKVLEIDKKIGAHYETLYFDTEDCHFYHQHHNGKLNRYKVRYRRYIDSDLCFLEVKFKSNKGRTIKKRKRKKNIKEIIPQKSKKFVDDILSDIKSDSLKPQLWVYYNRITLVHKFLKERLTIDLDLKFKKDKNEKSLPQLIIAEVKQEKLSLASHFIQFARQKKLLQTGFSKYCIGTALTNEQVKYNRFKPKLITLNKINYGRYAIS